MNKLDNEDKDYLIIKSVKEALESLGFEKEEFKNIDKDTNILTHFNIDSLGATFIEVHLENDFKIIISEERHLKLLKKFTLNEIINFIKPQI